MTTNKKAEAEQTVTVQWPNVWTSQGKFLKGADVTLPAAEVEALGDAVAPMVEKKAAEEASK